MPLDSHAERLSLALAAAKLGDWQWDAATDLVTLSDRACEILDVASKLTRAAMLAKMHPDDVERVRGAVQEAINTRTDYAIEHRVTRDGDPRWILVSGRPVFVDDDLIGMIGVVQDVTEQAQTRERLRLEAESLDTINRVGQMLAGELELQKLVQSVTDAATELTRAEFGAFFYNVLDAKGESYMLYALSGVPAERFSGFPMPRSTAVFAPTFKGEGVIRLDDVRKDPRFGKNDPHYGMPKGHLPVVSYLAVPVISRSGEVIGGLFFGHSQPGVFGERAERIVTGMAGQAAIAVDNARLFEALSRDVEERKRSAELIERSEARFREVTSSNTSLTLYEQDLELRYTWVFPTLPEHVTNNIGKTDVDLLGPSGEPLMQAKRDVIATGIGCRREFTVDLPSGQHVYDLVIEPRRDASGRIIGVGGVGVDVTQQKQNEQLLQRAQHAARESEARLRDADRRKDQFLAMLAHELRNPLAPIRTGLHLLRVSTDGATMADVRAMMERQVGHMVRLVDDLLDVSRITSGKIQLRREHVTLDELIGGAVDANRAALDAAKLVLDLDVRDGARPLFVDATRVVQIVSNVLNNAVKFSAPGDRIVLVARVESDGSDSAAVITVSDEGTGIDPAILPNIFDLFVQGTATSGGQGGLGIGLALARRLIEMHGGVIDAHSAGLGKGSSFTMKIPITSGVPAPEPINAPHAASTTDRRVLIVDDNADSAEVLQMLVSHWGASVRTAHDGESAIQVAEEFKPDVVLLDIGLPGMDGYDTCRRLREQGFKNITIVALTGWGQDRDKRRAEEAGFDAHLTKPADPAALESLLMKGAGK